MQTAAHRLFCHWSQSKSTAVTLQCLKCRAVTLQESSRAYSVIPPPRDSEEKEMMHRMLRVDHAGEYGANRIYAGQMAVLGRSRTGPLIQEMWDQEKKHLEKFNEILAENRVRPTALLPLWNIAGFVLGASSALLGKEGAMACTVAVEESITEHYNNQIRALMEIDPERYTELLQVIKEFRDDEMEHHDTGLEHDAETYIHGLKVLWLSFMLMFFAPCSDSGEPNPSSDSLTDVLFSIP